MIAVLGHHHSRHLHIGSDSGETLIELLMAIAIMGIVAVSLVGGVTTSIIISGIHRNQGTAGAAVRSYAESIVKYVSAGSYVDCATTSSYVPATVGYTVPTGFTVPAYTIQYWTGSAWGACQSPDSGIQQVTLTVRSSDQRATESLAVVLRKPCGIGSSCP